MITLTSAKPNATTLLNGCRAPCADLVDLSAVALQGFHERVARADPELGIDVPEVILDGLRAHEHCRGGLPRRLAIGKQAGDFELLGSELVERPYVPAPCRLSGRRQLRARLVGPRSRAEELDPLPRLSPKPDRSLPLSSHFEQQFHVRHRLDRYGARQWLDYADASPQALADALVAAIDSNPSYRATDPGGASRAAAVIAELLWLPDAAPNRASCAPACA